jgi:LuxR family maltose regulon positive regulatory protein
VDARLAATKVAPPEDPPGYVERPRLLATLDEGVTRRVTLVTGGPGWGKTTLLASWARRPNAVRPVVWLTLDEDDDQPQLFWSSVLVALRSSGVVPADNPLAVVEPVGTLSPALHRQIQVGLAQLTADVVLVLDDVHVLRSDEVHEQLGRLFRYESPLRLVLGTRIEPRRLLQRVRLTGELTEVRSDDLAFTAAEATELLQRQGLLPAQVAEAAHLFEQTDGWAAGLRLAAMSLGRSDADAADLNGVGRSVADYLADEVAANESPQTWQFLLRTSLVARVSADLANVLTGRRDGYATLGELERNNAFVTALGPDRTWYRYHPLLSDMLRRRIEVERPEIIGELHERAAHWFALDGQPINAVRHAAAARNWPLVGSMVTNFAVHRVLAPDRDVLASILKQIPTSAQAATPELQLCAAALCLVENRIADMEPHLVVANELMSREKHAADPSTRITLALLAGALARGRGSAATVVEATSRALDILDSVGSAVPLAREFRGVALNNKGSGLVWLGELADAEKCLTAGLTASDQLGATLAHMNTLGHLSLAAAVVGRLDEATEWATRGRELAEARGWTYLTQASTIFLSLAVVSLQQNDLDEADHLVTLGLQAQSEPLPLLALRLTQASIETARGRLGVARSLVDEVRSAAERRPLPALLQGWLVLTGAELELVTGQAAELQARLARAPLPSLSLEGRLSLARARFALGETRGVDALLSPVLNQERDLRLAIEASVVHALVADRAGRDTEALEALGRAVRQAEQGRSMAAFRRNGSGRLQRLLGRLAALRKADAAFLRRLLDEPSPTGPADLAPVVEALTERETLVLQHLSTMFTNAEIAEQLFVSPNTIKVHLRHLYRKLGVSSRRAAVSRARELRLLVD